MDLGKIGDQNVEFFKGRPSFFCATKSVQPFKSYDRTKIGKGEKEHKNTKKFHSYSCQHVLVAPSCIFSLLMFTTMIKVLPCQLIETNFSKKSLKSGKKWAKSRNDYILQAYSWWVCVYMLVYPNQAAKKGQLMQRTFIWGFTGPV